MGVVQYGAIVKASVDLDGNLRLYRRRRLFTRQAIFHPAYEWTRIALHANGDCFVRTSTP